MKKSDASRLIGTVIGTKGATDDLRRRPQEIAAVQRPPRIGTAIVRTVSMMGRDSFCDVAVIEKGRPTGIEWNNAACYGSRLAVGDTVSYVIREDGAMELIGATAITTTGGTTVSNNYSPIGWVA